MKIAHVIRIDDLQKQLIRRTICKKIARNNDLQNLPKTYEEDIYMIATNVCSHDLSYIKFPFSRLENLFSFVVKRMEIIYHIGAQTASDINLWFRIKRGRR